jgi:predicted DNA-binding ribbon-helix-helix protein
MMSEAKPGAPVKIVKHSLAIAGHRTSISLEAPFWDGLKRLASARGQSVASLVASIDATRGGANLSSAIRVFVLNAAARQNLAELSADLEDQAGR